MSGLTPHRSRACSIAAAACLLPAIATSAQDVPPPTEVDAPLADTTDLPAIDDLPPGESLVDVSTAPLRLDPVVVTARRFVEPAQSVPIGVTVVDRQTIEDGNITSIREASRLVPNMIVTEFTSRRLSFPTIRGISTGVGDPSVTTYVDGVPQLGLGSTNITMLDMERVEFLRGPQGTLFGRNSIGGVILLETEQPTNAHQLRGQLTWGNYSTQEYAAMYSGPIIEDKLFVSLSGEWTSRDGYTTNAVTGNKVDDRESTFGRGKILWSPDEHNDIEFTTYGERSRDGGFGLGFLPAIRADANTIAEDFEGRTNRNIWSNALTWTHRGDAIDITSISSYVDWKVDETSDFDFSPIDGVRRATKENEEYFYQELRVSSPEDAPLKFGEHHEVKWIVGGTYFNSDGQEKTANDFRPGGANILFPASQVGVDSDRGDFDDWGLSVFGQATWTIAEVLDLSAGVRYDYEDKEADITNMFEVGGFPVLQNRVSRDESFDEWSPTFSVGYHVNDDALIYGRAAHGFKAGGFNLRAPSGDETFDNETSWSYEGGIKTSWFDGRLIANAAFFYIDWDDLQLSLFDSVSGGYIANAGQATSKGAELELTARVTEGLDVFAAYGYTHAEFDSFTDQYGQDVSGKKLPFVPEHTFNIGAQLRAPLGGGYDWFARGEYTYTGTYHLDAGNTETESYGLATFTVGVERDNLRVELWIKNAFDQEYVPVAFQPSPFDPTTFVGESGIPATLGVTASLRF